MPPCDTTDSKTVPQPLALQVALLKLTWKPIQPFVKGQEPLQGPFRASVLICRRVYTGCESAVSNGSTCRRCRDIQCSGSGSSSKGPCFWNGRFGYSSCVR